MGIIFKFILVVLGIAISSVSYADITIISSDSSDSIVLSEDSDEGSVTPIQNYENDLRKYNKNSATIARELNDKNIAQFSPEISSFLKGHQESTWKE
jgi:hypothetical protein